MTRSRWWRRGGVIHPARGGIIVMPTSTGTVDVANLAPSGPPAASAEVERRLREALEMATTMTPDGKWVYDEGQIRRAAREALK
jgi:hypothetical protein